MGARRITQPMPTFVLIGHCGPDSYLLKGAIGRAVPGASIVFAEDDDSLRLRLAADSILLINRVLDDGFDTESGVELIERLAKAAPRPIMMLISNHDDAQQRALAVGAMPGFGKRAVNQPRTADLLRLAAEVAASAPATTRNES